MRLNLGRKGRDLSHHNLLGLHVVAVDEAEHVDTGSGLYGLAARATDALAAQDAARNVNHLQGGIAIVADHPVAVAVEGKSV